MLRLAVALAVLSLAAPARAQGTADLVSWSVRGDAAGPGGSGEVVLQARIAPGWRLYALDSPVGRPLAVTVEASPDGVTVEAPRQSTPQSGHDAAFGEDYTYFTGAVRLALPVRVGRAVPRGRHAVVGTVRYAVCDDSICLPPASTPFRAPLTVR